MSHLSSSWLNGITYIGFSLNRVKKLFLWGDKNREREGGQEKGETEGRGSIH